MIDCAVADILRESLSEQINLPKIVGFDVESCRLQAMKQEKRKKIRSEVEEKENIHATLDKYVVFEMSEDNKPSTERCNQIFNWLTKVK